MRLISWVSTCALLTVSTSATADFDWGTDCSSGEGAFSQYVPRGGSGVKVGEIPVGKKDVVIHLGAKEDVDVQLYTKGGTPIIGWPSGSLSGPTYECAILEGLKYCYSGYNGTHGNRGNETIEIHGVTNHELEMRAWGYQAGDATVDYQWTAVNTCNEAGSGTFTQYIGRNTVVNVGTIPAGKYNVEIELTEQYGNDVDVQLFEGNTAVVQWPTGLLNGPTSEETTYAGMTVQYSGYNGIGGNWGRETIGVLGQVTRNLDMWAFGYAPGTAKVDYRWGVGAGAPCEGHVVVPYPPCEEGFRCKDVVSMGRARDVPGECHSDNWCVSEEMAEENCSGLVHPMVVGNWGCEAFECVWRSGPSTEPICEVTPDQFGFCDAVAMDAWALIQGECRQVSGCPGSMQGVVFHKTQLDCLNHCATDTCSAWRGAFAQEFETVGSCTHASQCQAVPGTSCGCTRNLVANGADHSFDDLMSYLEGRSNTCGGMVTTCDCPPVDLSEPFLCEQGRCRWNYTNN